MLSGSFCATADVVVVNVVDVVAVVVVVVVVASMG